MAIKRIIGINKNEIIKPLASAAVTGCLSQMMGEDPWLCVIGFHLLCSSLF